MADKNTKPTPRAPAEYSVGQGVRNAIGSGIAATGRVLTTAAAAPLLAPTIAAVQGLRNLDSGAFVRGLLGGPVVPVDSGVAAAPAQAPVVAAATANGPSFDPATAKEESPQQLALDRLGAILGASDVSHRRLMQAVQGVGQVSPKPLSPKDASGAQAEAMAQGLLNSTMAETEAQRKAGNLGDAEAKKASDAAVEKYLQQRNAIWLGNPVNAAIAAQMGLNDGIQ